jgi:hypothetical protein
MPTESDVRGGGGGVSRARVQAVCDMILASFPSAGSNLPRVPKKHLDPTDGAAIIESDIYRLRISEECFGEHEPQAIANALISLGYADLFTENRAILLGCLPHRVRAGARVLAGKGDWYLAT